MEELEIIRLQELEVLADKTDQLLPAEPLEEQQMHRAIPQEPWVQPLVPMVEAAAEEAVELMVVLVEHLVPEIPAEVEQVVGPVLLAALVLQDQPLLELEQFPLIHQMRIM